MPVLALETILIRIGDLSRVGTHSIRQVISPSPLSKIGLTPLPTMLSDGRFNIRIETEIKRRKRRITKSHRRNEVRKQYKEYFKVIFNVLLLLLHCFP